MRLSNSKNGCRGFSLLEIVIVVTILSILTAGTIPLVRNTVKREREADLRLGLRQLRQAIDAYKRYNDTNLNSIPIEWRTPSGYPKELKLLVDGFIPANVIGTSSAKVKFLRRMPVDPMTDKAEWGLRSFKEGPDSTSWSGEDVYDVYSKSADRGLNGTMYKNW